MRGHGRFQRMTHAQRQREIHGEQDPGPAGPRPPDSLTRDVETAVSVLYFEAAHEAARRQRDAIKKVEDGNDAFAEEAAMYGTLARGHLAAYRDAKPDDLHRGGRR